MKKPFLVLATITAIVFASCSKEKIETQDTINSGEIVTAKKPGSNGLPPVSNKGLLGRFEFNNNLKDATNQLPDGVSTANRVLYTTDRKGNADNAIRFNEAYGVNLSDIPWTPETSLSVWIKHDVPVSPNWYPVVVSWEGFIIQQLQTTFNCSYVNNINVVQDVYAFPVDNKWHHLAATRDNNEMKFYVDGVLIGSSPTPAGVGPYPPFMYYQLGYGFDLFWKGNMDDLRFYERILTASEINTLANS